MLNAASILFVAVCGCGESTQKETTAIRKLIKVETAKPQQRTFQHRIRVQGTVNPTEQADIASRTSGNLDALFVSDGDRVKRGTLLFQVDQKNLENKVAVARQDLAVAEEMVKTAEAELKIGRTKLEKAKIDYRRAERLISERAISSDDYEIRQMNFKNAEAEVRKFEAMLDNNRSKVELQKVQLEIALKNLADSRVVAPFDGIVTAKNKEQNEYVANGTVVLHLENHSGFEISCLISAVYYPQIAAGKTKANLLFDGHPLCSSIVSYRSRSIDPLSRTFELKIPVPRGVPMVSGILCNVDLILEERNGWGVPGDAVMLRKGGSYQVYAVHDGRAQAIAVTPGIRSDGYTELREGEKLKDESLVVSGQYFLNSGDLVKVINQDSASPAPESR